MKEFTFDVRFRQRSQKSGVKTLAKFVRKRVRWHAAFHELGVNNRINGGDYFYVFVVHWLSPNY
jgi:hypothetical protein